MNAIFAIITIAATSIMIITNPSAVLPALSDGVNQAILLSVKLFAVYTLWLGIFELIKSGGIGRLLTKILEKPLSVLFKKPSTEASRCITLNISSNILGLGGIATPTGIKAQALLEKENNVYAQNMLFVLASTSIQIFPITVIGLRTTFNSTSPQDIIITTLLSTAVSTISGILLVNILSKK